MPTARKLLQTAQRAWIAFRDAECDYSTAASDGRLHPSDGGFGMPDRLTKERDKQLAATANCEEGDASCASPDEARTTCKVAIRLSRVADAG